MRLLVEPSESFFMAGDVMVRLWTGTVLHDDGRSEEAVALISAVGFGGQAEALSEGLVSIPPPDAEAAQRWAQTVLAKANGSHDG